MQTSSWEEDQLGFVVKNISSISFALSQKVIEWCKLYVHAALAGRHLPPGISNIELRITGYDRDFPGPNEVVGAM
jgi:hypothetical protein